MAIDVNTTPVSADEIERRVAILRRFRELLIQQRERFHHYLTALEKQQTVIESGNTDELIAHVELEEQIVADIFSIQKVIDPLDHLYQTAIPFSPANAQDSDVPALKLALENLKTRAVTQSAHNRDLLSSRMAGVRAEIAGMRNNPFMSVARSSYHHSATASLVDIKG